MPRYYAYSNTIYGAQSTVNGGSHNYAYGPPAGGSWSYSGNDFQHVVYERDSGAVNYNGDPDNETVQSSMDVGRPGEQSVSIGGTQRAALYDYSFAVSDGTNTYEIAVIDVDLTGDGTISGASENGYYLVFVGDVPPPDTVLTIQGITGNSDNISHFSLGGTIVCFAGGTLIRVKGGEKPVEDLRPGDLVATMEHGFQPLRWAGRRAVAGRGRIAPVRFAPGAIGNERELLLSPQHRVLAGGAMAELLFGAGEVLVPACYMVNGDTVQWAPRPRIAYHHLLFDRHEIIFAEGAAAESFHPGKEAMGALSDASRAEILALFPELAGRGGALRATARPVLKRHEAMLLCRAA